MKKLLVVLLALGALSFAPEAEAGRYRKKSCDKPKCQPKPKCKTPKCTTDVQKETYYRPCRKLVEVEGQCPWERCITTTRCVEESNACVGPCEATCENAVNPSNRTMSSKRYANEGGKGYASDEEYEEAE